MSAILPVHWGLHVTITHGALDLTVQGPQPPWTSVVGPPAHPALAPAPYYWHLVANNWRPVQTCSLEDPSSALSNLCSVLKNSSTIFSLIPPYPERSYVRTLNGNSITHSHSSGWLLFKVPQHTRKTSLFRDTWHYQIMLSIHLAIGIHRVRIIHVSDISAKIPIFWTIWMWLCALIKWMY